MSVCRRNHIRYCFSCYFIRHFTGIFSCQLIFPERWVMGFSVRFQHLLWDAEKACKEKTASNGTQGNDEIPHQLVSLVYIHQI